MNVGNVTAPAGTSTAVNDKAKALKAAGRDVISLAGGDPDFDTPAHIVQAAFDALNAGETHYPPSRGTLALRQAIADKMAGDNNLSLDPATQVLVTPGAKWAIYTILVALTDPGDEVLVLEPYWVSYVPMVTLAGATPVTVTLPAAENFAITAANLEAHITSRTKAILVNSPNNPTGRVLTPAEAEVIRQLALTHDLYIIFDEIYEKLVYDGVEHCSIASFGPEIKALTIVVNGVSKAYSMTGWRIGFAGAEEEVIAGMNKVQSHEVSHPSSISQKAAVEALIGPQESVEEMRVAFDARRRYMVERLNNIEGVRCPKPSGAFYTIAELPVDDCDTFCQWILEKFDHEGQTVMLAPASGFYATPALGKQQVRIAYVLNKEALAKAITCLDKALKVYPGRTVSDLKADAHSTGK